MGNLEANLNVIRRIAERMRCVGYRLENSSLTDYGDHILTEVTKALEMVEEEELR